MSEVSDLFFFSASIFVVKVGKSNVQYTIVYISSMPQQTCYIVRYGSPGSLAPALRPSGRLCGPWPWNEPTR